MRINFGWIDSKKIKYYFALQEFKNDLANVSKFSECKGYSNLFQKESVANLCMEWVPLLFKTKINYFMMSTVGFKSSNNRLSCKNHEVYRQQVFTKMVLCFRATGVVINVKHENATAVVVGGMMEMMSVMLAFWRDILSKTSELEGMMAWVENILTDNKMEMPVTVGKEFQYTSKGSCRETCTYNWNSIPCNEPLESPSGVRCACCEETRRNWNKKWDRLAEN